MDENKLLNERKEKLASFLKQDIYFSVFAGLAVFSLLSAALVKIGFSYIIGVFPASIWLVLFVCSLISAALAFYKKHKFSFYPILAWIVWLAVYIRTLNLPRLRDITTGGWTLGPDLDPFLFMRWAKYIVAHGSLMLNDAMRYVPVGYDTKNEMILLPYLMAWFHKLASWFGSSSIEQSSALFPAFMFAITILAFFLLVRKIFARHFGEAKASITALIASIFLSIIPALLPRTIAGIPEKESAAFFFLFIAFYFFLCAWQAEKAWARIIFALLAGLATAGMALVWGGVIYIFITIALAVFVAFILGQVDFNKFYAYAIWLFSWFVFVQPFSTRYSLEGFIGSPTTGVAIGVFAVILVHLIIYKTKIQEYFSSEKLRKIPKPLISIIVAVILGIIAGTIFFGPGFFVNISKDVLEHLITPVSDRISITVAENRQPFFGEWANSFGPRISGIPITFWLFFIGSIFLFYKMMRSFGKKEKIAMTISYAVFLFCIIFSRYSSDSSLNGTSGVSLFVYALGFIALVGTIGFYLYQYYKKGEEAKLHEIEFGPIMLFALFFLAIISARGAVRTIMVLVPPASIIIAYLFVASLNEAKNSKDKTIKVIAWILAALVVLSSVFAGYNFYRESAATASGYVPSSYNQQWQKAMSWVRDNTPQDAVFTHWWDYGYWLQSIGNRATVVDGGNSIGYWNHLMGRHGLTSPNDTDTLEFFKTHNVNYFLIDSSDIGKYPAFSSIGSDLNYDRYSWLNTMILDKKQTMEMKNSTMFAYSGGTPLDGDIVYDDNGTKIFLPGGKAGVAGVLVERNKAFEIISQPIGVFIYQNRQYRIPLRYIYDGKLIDFKSGLNAGLFLMDKIDTNSDGGGTIERRGAAIYLSSKTVQSTLARYYLYKEAGPYIKLVHTEDDFAVAYFKSINATSEDILYYGGIRGPIRIWEISYPANIKANPQYLNTSYSDINLLVKVQ